VTLYLLLKLKTAVNYKLNRQNGKSVDKNTICVYKIFTNVSRKDTKSTKKS